MSVRKRYVYRDGEMVEEAEYQSQNRSAYVIDDTMPLTEHHADGQYYDSKSEYRRVTRAHGCIEAGNDLITKQRSPEKHRLSTERIRDIGEKAWHDLRNRSR